MTGVFLFFLIEDTFGVILLPEKQKDFFFKKVSTKNRQKILPLWNKNL
ncbi:MAG: hypothetical protein J5725_04205 [Bacteroidales bacterium]|nr:hypothetical protein [Bacteroidales bacterium]